MALDLGMPILVVDDYQTMVRIIRNLLKQLGFEEVDRLTPGLGAAWWDGCGMKSASFHAAVRRLLLTTLACACAVLK